MLGFRNRAKKNNVIEQITPSELKKKMSRDKELVVLDVRSPQEYATGHIKGTRLLPLANLSQRINEVPQSATVVCVCRSGARSMVASELLVKAGYKNVINMSGGMMAWAMAKLPMVK